MGLGLSRVGSVGLASLASAQRSLQEFQSVDPKSAGRDPGAMAAEVGEGGPQFGRRVELQVPAGVACESEKLGTVFGEAACVDDDAIAQAECGRIKSCP